MGNKIGDAQNVMIERLQSVATMAVRAQSADIETAANLIDDIQRDLDMAKLCINQLLGD